jgi:Protein of unknown function (DUF3592)
MGVKQRIGAGGVTRRVPGKDGLVFSVSARNNEKRMRSALLGIGVVAVLVCVYLLTHQFPSTTLRSAGMLIFFAAFVMVFVGAYWIRRKRLQEWSPTSGRMESCSLGSREKDFQTYYCTYLFSVDGARQAGQVTITDKPNRLEEIKAALVGEQVTVRYDPSDCTRSIIEETQINGWKVS